MSDDTFDAIVVGAGMAGTAAAYLLAKGGKSVLLVEVGDGAGKKAITGGRIYTKALDLVEPGFASEAPLERAVTHEQLMLLHEDRSTTIEYTDPSFGGARPQSHTILRGTFDEWFVAKAEEQGVMFVPANRVDGLVERDGRIVGVKAGDDEILADIVIAADGSNSQLAQKAGLREDLTAQHTGLAVKEVIELPAKEIEARFNLAPGEGAARMILGGAGGIHGGTFLYTNRESLSLGCVFLGDSLAKSGRPFPDLFQDVKQHPALQALIAGGKSVEYSACILPEGGWDKVPQRLYRDGFLTVGAAAGFVLNQGYTIRGMDLAMMSGIAAAQAVLGAKSAAEVGPLYLQQLEQIGVIPAMKRFARTPHVLRNQRFYSDYPAMANDILQQLFRIEGQPPLRQSIMTNIRAHGGFLALAKDAWRVMRAL